MPENLDANTKNNELRIAVSMAIFGAILIVAFALVTVFTDLAGLSGIGIGVGFLLIWGGRALWLLRNQRRSAL